MFPPFDVTIDTTKVLPALKPPPTSPDAAATPRYAVTFAIPGATIPLDAVPGGPAMVQVPVDSIDGILPGQEFTATLTPKSAAAPPT